MALLEELYWVYVRPDAITVWRNEEVRRRLSWYLAVMRGEKPPKFKLARLFKVPFDSLREIEEAELGELMKVHSRVAEEFRAFWRRVRDGSEEYREMEPASHNLLDLKAVIMHKMASPCILCERRCRVERASGKRGACRISWEIYVHSAFLHLGEESPLVPSGTIFYGGCNFTCVFCQNWDVSQWEARSGLRVTARELAEIQDKLAAKGARNINHVGGEPTPSLHYIVESMRYATHNKPQLWNSNMYMSTEALEVLVDLIDIWLPDLKFGNDKCARRLSAVPRYWEVSTRNLKIAVEHGDMIIRHLVMPNHLECCTFPVLEWIAKNLPKDRILVNVMEQYRPENLVLRHPWKWKDIARRPTDEEIRAAREYATKLGLLWEPVS